MSSYKKYFGKSKSVHSWFSSIVNDPYYTVNNIAERFNYNVPKVEKKPEYSDYGLSENINEQIEKEETLLGLKYSLFLILLYIVVITIVAAVLYYRGKSIGEIGGYAFLFFWFGLLAYQLFIGNWINSIVKGKINSSTLKTKYQKYLDDLDAYNYWREMQSLDYWMRLDGHQFENAVANVFREKGYIATVSKQGGDGGIDIVIMKDGEEIAVECKAHKKPIGPDVARDLYGTMAHFGYNKGLIVSRSGFTSGVYDFIKGKNIGLYNLQRIMSIQK